MTTTEKATDTRIKKKNKKQRADLLGTLFL